MTIKKLKVLVFFYCFALTAFAGGIDSGFETGCFIATLSVAPGWARPGQSQNLTLQPDVLKSYIPNPNSRTIKLVSTAQGTDSLIAGELFVGMRGLINSAVEGQVGLALGTASQIKLKGSIYEDLNPQFNNFKYTYGVQNVARAALKLKFLYDINFYDLFPYFSASAGAGFNRSSGFTITPRIVEEVPAPIFSNKKLTEFSFSYGLGLDAVLDTYWRLGLGYEYVNWGKSALGLAIGQLVGTKGLRLGSVRVHELLVSISYVA